MLNYRLIKDTTSTLNRISKEISFGFLQLVIVFMVLELIA